MSNTSFAPIKRAGLFFGCMGAAVFALTLGSGLQQTNPSSSEAVAATRIERETAMATQLASVDPSQRSASVVKRAIPSSRQAALQRDDGVVLR